MAAGRYSFVIEQGATTDFEIIYKDSNNDPVDLSGHRARMQIRAAQTASSEAFLTLSSSLMPDGTGLNLSGSSGTNPPESGSIGIFISYTTASALNFNNAYYDLELVSGTGNSTRVTRVLAGAVGLSREITSGSF
tara:strand:+ start:1495 stop:1899 length:405 start_codon:yes stop_codon:yes gene_type:complete